LFYSKGGCVVTVDGDGSLKIGNWDEFGESLTTHLLLEVHRSLEMYT